MSIEFADFPGQRSGTPTLPPEVPQTQPPRVSTADPYERAFEAQRHALAEFDGYRGRFGPSTDPDAALQSLGSVSVGPCLPRHPGSVRCRRGG